MIWTFLLKNFLTLKSLGVFVLLAIGFYIGRGCENKTKQRAVNRVESKLSEKIKESRNLSLKDSTTIAQRDTSINNLKTSLTLSQNLIGQYQVSEQANKLGMIALRKELQASKELVKKAIDAGTIVCDTLILQREQKLFSNKYYYVIIPKPENLKSLIRD